MNIIGRLTGETVLVAMNNEEAATLLTMEAAAEQAAEKTAWEEWGGVMEAAKEVEERAARGPHSFMTRLSLPMEKPLCSGFPGNRTRRGGITIHHS